MDTGYGISFGAAFRVWLRIALLSFGGPAGQIAVMHRILVDEKNWISESRFLHALNFCMLLPGPEAQQLATYIGWLLHRTAGGIMAGGLFMRPASSAIMALSCVYAGFGNLGFIAALFFGLKAAVLAIVIQAVVRLGKRALRNRIMLALAAIAFVAIFFFNWPFPAIIIVAGVIGWIGGGTERPNSPRLRTVAERHPAAIDSMLGDGLPDHVRPSVPRALKVGAVWLLLWLAPVGALLMARGEADVFSQIALFFSKMAMVTFGGAYAVLAYVAQQAVEHYHWLGPREMLDGLGMAETTPGPLIMVLQFVGFMAAYRDPGTLSPMLAGALGGLLATWVTFTPCFLLDLSGRALHRGLARQQGAGWRAAAITAAVVGVILNLSIWFALHTVFRESLPVRIVWTVVRHAGVVEPRCSRAHSGHCRRDCGLPLQARHADGAGRLMRRRGDVATDGSNLGHRSRLGAPRRKTMKRSLALLTLAAAAFPAFSNAAEVDWNKVDAALGKTATVSGDVHRYGLPRSDLHVTLDGVTIKPALALGGWVAFAPMHGEAMVMGDLVLLETEIKPVMTRLLDGGLDITAIHNHVLRASPATFYMHVGGHGDPEKMATVIRSALSASKTPFDSPATTAGPAPSLDLDTAKLDEIMHVKGTANGGVYQFGMPRRDPIMENGMQVTGALGGANGINFQPLGNGKAAITGDFLVTGNEVSPLIRALRAGDIEVTAIHSHMLDEQPRMFFIHFWANDDAQKLAHGVRAALETTAIATR